MKGVRPVALARLASAARVIAIGAPADRLSLARAMGADEAFDVASTTPAERLEAIHELVVDITAEIGLPLEKMQEMVLQLSFD